MKKILFLIFLSGCSFKSDSKGPTATERQLSLCKQDLAICEGRK